MNTISDITNFIFIGKKIGHFVGDKFQILGGVILILIGIKILLGF